MELSKEEKEAISQCRLLLEGEITLHIIGDDGGTDYSGKVNKAYNEDLKIVLNLVEKQQEKIEEKSTIIMAGAEKVKQLEKEIILLKIEKLRATKLYKECHLSQIPDTANIYYSMKLELEAIDEEISNLIRILENY